VASFTTFPQPPKVLKVAEVRAVRSPPTLCMRRVRAVSSNRMPCDGDHFTHAQRQRRTWRCGDAVGSSRAPCARCKDAVKFLYLEAAFVIICDYNTSNHEMYHNIFIILI